MTRFAARARLLGVASIIAIAALFAGSATHPRPVLADHGATLWGTSGVWGAWRAPLLDYSFNPPTIIIHPPDGIGATYSKDDAAYSQLVWWTPRIWWQDPDGSLHHSFVDNNRSDYGWYYTWVRPGNSYGSMVAFVERGSTFGSAFPAWNDVNGVTQGADFTVAIYPNTTTSKVFVVEFIFYWASNPEQPYDGWLSQLWDFGDGYGSRYRAVDFS